MSKRDRNLIRDAMMFAVKDISGRVLREAAVQSMIDDFLKSLNQNESQSDSNINQRFNKDDE